MVITENPKPPSDSFSILIADDEMSVVITLQKLIERRFANARIFTASDGKEAWDIITTCKPNIIISDYSMPIIDGLQLLIKVRANVNYNDIIFIMLTGNSDLVSRIQALDKGADEFITKPIVSDALEARLRSALRIVALQNKMREENKLLMELADELEKDVQDMAMLSVKFMQARIPASYESLQRIAAASLWIGKQLNQFAQDELRDIEIAGYLCQCGRMALPDDMLKMPIMQNGKATHSLMHQVPITAKEIVSGVRRFADVGKILYHLYENFDGSGFPSRLQSWQIPIASRIVRVAADYEEYRNLYNKKPGEIFEIMNKEAKRLYDFRLVILMEHFVRSNDKAEFTLEENALLLSDLKEGMQLSRDIITDKGLKLMPAGATLSSNVISKIISHNTSDHIIGNVYVKKK